MIRYDKILISTFLIFLLNISPWCIASTQAKVPHGIILISLDTLRADHLGCYGYHRNTSPNIDAFAKQSIVFEHAVVQSPWTIPSHMSIMTSLYSSFHGVLKENERLADDHLTLAELLREGGYRTAAFTDGGWMSAVFGFDQGFDIYDDRGGGIARILPRVKKWIDGNKSEPFFLFIHCYDIHGAYYPPPPYNSIFYDFTYTGNFDPSNINLEAAVKKNLEVSNEDLRHIKALYDGCIRYTDEKTGEFLSYLKDSELEDQSLIIITSDHGEEFKEHGSFLHWQLYYRPNLQVPLIMCIPNYPKKEIRINELVQSIDLLPTVLEFTGLPPHTKAQGISLLPLIKRHKNFLNHSLWQTFRLFKKDSNPSFAEYYYNWSVIDDEGYQMIYDPMRHSIQLFDLKVDPLAQNNIAKDHDDITKRLLSQHKEIYSKAPTRKTPTITLDVQTREQLKALGYLDDLGYKTIGLSDSDSDDIPDKEDNCPYVANPNQEDTYPPGGNNCGDACECKGNIDGDKDVDTHDILKLNQNIGRKNCTQKNPCNGDFDCDGDVDDDDYIILKENIGRNDCAACEFSCSYD